MVHPVSISQSARSPYSKAATASSAGASRLAVLGLAAALAAVVTVAVAEFRPARSLGPIAGAAMISATPSRADLDFAHQAFEQFRDRPDDAASGRAIALARRAHVD